MSDRAKLEWAIARHGAPVLSGLKVASLLTVRPSDFEDLMASLDELCQLLTPHELRILDLAIGPERILLYIYRPEWLERLLSLAEHRRFLADCGYARDAGCADCLAQLFERMRNGRGEDYPHELGLFLGYPLEDVRGFMLDRGRCPLYTGLWHVYSEVERARQRFADFEHAKRRLLAGLSEGCGLCEQLPLLIRETQQRDRQHEAPSPRLDLDLPMHCPLARPCAEAQGF